MRVSEGERERETEQFLRHMVTKKIRLQFSTDQLDFFEQKEKKTLKSIIKKIKSF